MTVTCQRGFPDVTNVPLWLRTSVWVGAGAGVAGALWEISLPSAPFCCESGMALKSKVYLKKIKEAQPKFSSRRRARPLSFCWPWICPATPSGWRAQGQVSPPGARGTGRGHQTGGYWPLWGVGYEVKTLMAPSPQTRKDKGVSPNPTWAGPTLGCHGSSTSRNPSAPPEGPKNPRAGPATRSSPAKPQVDSPITVR